MKAFKYKPKEGDVIHNNLSVLLKDISDGNKEALKDLYDNMSKDIYTFLLMFCKNREIAEDAVQETFISIYKNAKTFRKNPKAWILTIAKNEAVSIIRKNSHTTGIETLEIEDARQTENVILDKIQADMLLSILSEEDKKIVILHAVYGLKHREIAKLINMPLGTVTWRYKQSIEKMKNKDSGEAFNKISRRNEV